jgi:hypothetical protein
MPRGERTVPLYSSYEVRGTGTQTLDVRTGDEGGVTVSVVLLYSENPMVLSVSPEIPRTAREGRKLCSTVLQGSAVPSQNHAMPRHWFDVGCVGRPSHPSFNAGCPVAPPLMYMSCTGLYCTGRYIALDCLALVWTGLSCTGLCCTGLYCTVPALYGVRGTVLSCLSCPVFG